MGDSYRTFGLLTPLGLRATPLLLDGRYLLCTIARSAMTCVLCTCILSLCLCLAFCMYISALTCALGTPSEFSSVPILVADELVQILIL